jgi:hypothetical protein
MGGLSSAARLKWKAASWMTARLGLKLYAPDIAWPHDSQFEAIGASSGVSGNTEDRCYFLFSAAESIARLEGEIAECGSRKGKSSLYILEGFGHAATKLFHAFDSFEGLSQPSEEDRSSNGHVKWAKGDLATPEQTLLSNLSRFGNRVRIHKGWIPERFNDVEGKKFCLVHIDVDLYQPTLDSLKFFYDRVVPRGIIICDDYGFRSCPGAKRAFDEFFSGKPEGIIKVPSGQALVVKA